MCAHPKYFVWVSEYGMGFALRLLHRRMIMAVCAHQDVLREGENWRPSETGAWDCVEDGII